MRKLTSSEVSATLVPGFSARERVRAFGPGQRAVNAGPLKSLGQRVKSRRSGGNELVCSQQRSRGEGMAAADEWGGELSGSAARTVRGAPHLADEAIGPLGHGGVRHA